MFFLCQFHIESASERTSIKCCGCRDASRSLSLSAGSVAREPPGRHALIAPWSSAAVRPTAFSSSRLQRRRGLLSVCLRDSASCFSVCLCVSLCVSVSLSVSLCRSDSISVSVSLSRLCLSLSLFLSFSDSAVMTATAIRIRLRRSFFPFSAPPPPPSRPRRRRARARAAALRARARTLPTRWRRRPP